MASHSLQPAFQPLAKCRGKEALKDAAWIDACMPVALTTFQRRSDGVSMAAIQDGSTRAADCNLETGISRFTGFIYLVRNAWTLEYIAFLFGLFSGCPRYPPELQLSCYSVRTAGGAGSPSLICSAHMSRIPGFTCSVGTSLRVSPAAAVILGRNDPGSNHHNSDTLCRLPERVLRA